MLTTRLPAKTKRRIYVPEKDEVIQLARCLKNERIFIPFLLATQCGLRASEICALEKKHIGKDCITVEQAYVDGDDGPVLKQPKSMAGYRSVPISPEFRDMLLSVKTGEDNRIVPLRSTNISTMWGKMRKKYGINKDCNFHALRHYYASICLLSGKPQKYIAEIMGHNSLDMIEKVYQHTFPTAMNEFKEQLRNENSEFIKAIK